MVPRHLAQVLSTNIVQHDDYRFEADFQCKCGCKIFQWFFPGSVRENDSLKRPFGIVVNEVAFFCIENQCAACESRVLIFDSHFHGWNGFICHEDNRILLPKPMMYLWNCPSCSGSKQSGRLGIASEGIEDFKDFLTSGIRRFKLDDWVDAFGWINISLTCEGCNLEIPSWVDYETM